MPDVEAKKPGEMVLPAGSCSHRFVVEAKGVYASIDPRNLTLRSDDVTWKYDSVTYCNNPTCEKVFRATMAHPLQTWRSASRGGE